MYDGYLRIKTQIDTKDFNAQIEEVESELQTLKRGFETTNEMPVYEGKNEDLQELSLRIEKVTNKLVDLKSKQQALDNQGFLDASKNIEKTSNGISKILKKLGKWTLALFGIRAMYGAIRQAVNVLTQYDEQLGANLDYMKYALANAVKPIIEWLVNAIYKLMTYVNYISQAWFGINLFKNSGVSDYNNAINKANKDTKELKKQLAGFDEINMVSDNTSSSDKSVLPSFDLSAQQIDVPDWVKWIADNKDTILQLASVVGIAFGASAIGNALGNISKLFGVPGGKGLIGLAGSLAGIVAIAGSIAIIAYVAASTWKDINKLKSEIDDINKKVGEQNKTWKEALDPVSDVDKLISTMETNMTAGNDNLKKSKNYLYQIVGLNEKQLDTAENVVKNSETSLNKLIEMYNIESRTKEEKEKILDIIKQQYYYNLDVISALDQEGRDTTTLKNLTQDYANVIAGIEGGYTNISKNIDKTKTSTKGLAVETNNIYDILDKLNVKKIDDKTFRVNGIMNIDSKTLDKMIDKTLTALSGLSFMGVKSIPSNLMSQIKSMVNTYKKQLGLASGGIVNMPGRGVPLSNVITGEAGREGVIPLTNPNAMAQLGQEIGKWVNINNSINNYMDSKKINTILAQSSNQQNMLRNGV